MGNPAKNESHTMRGVRYMTMLESRRPELRDDVRSYRDPNDLARSNASCDNVIDMAINRVAKSTIETGTDFSNPDELFDSVKSSIKKRFEEKPDKGFALGE